MYYLNEKLIFKKVIFVLLLAIAGCDQKDFYVDKPPSVPVSAQLTGGIDGWSWIDCKSISKIHLECKIYDQLGELSRTSFLQSCFNVRVKGKENLKVSILDETLIKFEEMYLYEYKPSIIEGDVDGKLALKYYNLFGVDEDCIPVSQGSELVVVGK